MRIPTSLRVALLSALLTLAATVALVGFIYVSTHDDALDAHRQRVVEEAAALGQVFASGGRPALDAAIHDILAEGDPQLFAAILDRSGVPLSGNVDGKVRLRPGYQDGVVRFGHPPEAIETGYVLRPLSGGVWLLSGRSYGERLSLEETLQRSLLFAIPLSLLLGLLCGAVIARYVGRRVASVVAVARSVPGGTLERRVPIAGTGDSFDELGRHINLMLDRIAGLMEELRLLTDCLAHDLRSPVGRLRARVDAAIAAESDERRQALLAGVVSEADSLMRMLTTVLEIGRSEAMASRSQFAALDAAELVKELADMYEPLAEESGVTVRVQAPAAAPLSGHRQLLAQALSNLIDNALKYAGSGGEILLIAEQRDGELLLGVADRGPGIAPSERAEARRRFGRLDSSRSTEGAGLGLALAEAVAHLHHGRLELDDNRPGLRALLAVPAASPA